MANVYVEAGSEFPRLQCGMLRLYSNQMCPFSERVRLVLAAKEHNYELIEVNLKNKPEWFCDINPEGSTPVLQLDEHRILYESIIICEYLDEALSGKQLVPFDPYIKAYHKLLVQKFSNVQQAFTKIARQNNANAVNDLKKALQKYEDNLKNNFFEGNELSLMDYMIWPWFERFPVLKEKVGFELDKKEFPKLYSWVERMREVDIIKKEIKLPQKYIEFYA